MNMHPAMRELGDLVATAMERLHVPGVDAYRLAIRGVCRGGPVCPP
jgi:hypothetical protein